MKRTFDLINNEQNEHERNSKVVLVERNLEPSGMSLVSSVAIAKKSYVEAMELAEGLNTADSFVQANAQNKLDIIGRQMRSLQGLMCDVLEETKVNTELHGAACNFVKKPGHIYHLYERPSGQQYFSMISPEEWVNAPHNYLGSWRLEADQSWTASDQLDSRFEGLHFLRDIFSNPAAKALMGSSR